jgi:small subunit ribosomal protein S9
MSKDKYYYGKGKRKSATSKVRLYINGSGKVLVNDKLIDEYTTTDKHKEIVLSPLKITNTHKLFDITAIVRGGGFSSQSESLRHGISKALLEYDSELRTTLKKEGFLTRDSRVKERKKPGLRRARRAPQFSKR